MNNNFGNSFADVKQQLQNGADPEDVFLDVHPFYEGFAVVKLGSEYNFKCNFIDTNNNLLRDDLWFDEAWEFHEGFAPVYVRGKGWNFINADGNILRDDMWFDGVGGFQKGLGTVYVKDRGWNFIKPDGNILRDDLWFELIDNFYEGFAVVELKGKYNFIDRNGNLLRDDLRFDEAGRFHKGFAKVILHDQMLLINKKGNLYDQDKNLLDIKRRTVRLTESQLRNTIKRVVSQCLKEGRIR